MRKPFYIILTLSFFYSCGNTKSKNTADEKNIDYLTKTAWMYKHKIGSLNFKSDVLQFVSQNSIDTIKPIYDKFTFNKNGTFEYSCYAPNVLFCGNGQLQIDKGNWEIENNNIEINVEGNYAFDISFDYNIIYRIDSISDTKMKLVKVKEVNIKEKKDY